MSPCLLGLLRGTVAAAAFVALPAVAVATPSSVFWTIATPYVQPYGVLHITYDTYFGTKGSYAVTSGLQIGVLPMKDVQAEIGFDLGYPTSAAGEPVDVPIALNAKVGGPEGALFDGAPGWSAGIAGVGFEEDATDYDILHAEIGKTFGLGTIGLGGYHGLNPDLLLSSAGEEHRTGFMASWTSQSIGFPATDHANLVLDVQTGDNVLGAAGGGIYLYFTPKVDLALGPVFFFDEGLQPGGSRWLWSLQFDADLDF